MPRPWRTWLPRPLRHNTTNQNLRIEEHCLGTLPVLAQQSDAGSHGKPRSSAGSRPGRDGWVGPVQDDTPSHEIAALAAVGAAFDWLANEPKLYDDACGEPL